MGMAMVMEINEKVTVAAGETVAIKAVIRVAIKVRVGIRGNSRIAKNRFCRRCSIKAAISRFDRDIPRTSTNSEIGCFMRWNGFGY